VATGSLILMLGSRVFKIEGLTLFACRTVPPMNHLYECGGRSYVARFVYAIVDKLVRDYHRFQAVQQ
jgi:hypothetical protein